jgi:mRNA deadenylase 3'-5' endonuclease subunit Ccr4
VEYFLSMLHIGTFSVVPYMDNIDNKFRQRKFTLKEVDTLNYDDEHGRVALIVVLEYIKSHRLMIFATTHIYWNQSQPDVQLAEVHQLEEGITKIVKHIRYTSPCNFMNIPIVLCGDFNSPPYSILYSYIKNNFFRYSYKNN